MRAEFQPCSPGAGVDDSDHLLPPARPARIRLCPLAASRLRLMAARSTFARAIRRSTVDSPAHRGTAAASGLALLARDNSVVLPANLPLSSLGPSFIVLLGTGLPALALIAATRGRLFAGFLSDRRHFLPVSLSKPRRRDSTLRTFTALPDSCARYQPCKLWILLVL